MIRFKFFHFGLLASSMLLSRAAQPVSPAPTPAQERDLLKEVRIPDGFDATIFAVPPAVNYPVFVAASPDGTLYVSSDKNGSLDRAPHRGRVLRVRDLDRDGHADEVKEFVPDVDSPRGLVWDRDRLYLLHPPHLSVFIDHDGDGVADEEKVLVKNIAFTFKDRPADHSSNGLELGVDGWIYCAIGDFGFMEAEGADGRKMQLRGGGVVRVRPDGSGLELYSHGTRNILEACVSPLLDVFARDNTNDGDGWDIRLHHFTGLSEHGYPSLFKHFKGEFVEPLADYGGGSGCGGMFLSEPGFPEGYNHALYTSDWGREWVYRHQLTPDGATFTANQTEFVRAPRVTDLDVDGMSRIYVSSWKGATFTYVGEDVGFLVRVTPKGFTPEPLPNFVEQTESQLIRDLESSSHRRRLAAQRELLHRDLRERAAVEQLAADGNKPLATRVAAIFLLKQKFGTGAHPFLVRLLDDPSVQEYAIRALCDVVDQTAEVPANALVRALRSANPRTRVQAAFGIARLNRPPLASAVTTLFDDPDPIVRHTAIQSVKALHGTEAAFAVLDSPASSEPARDAARQVLQAFHESAVVDGLARRLKNGLAANRPALVAALARLHEQMGEWKGDGWGTRPDTSGPYYQPEKWAESPRILAVLKTELQNTAGADAAMIVRELGRNKIQDPEILEMVTHLAERDSSLLPTALAQFARAERIPDAAVSLARDAATGTEVPALTRAHALIALAKTDRPDAASAMLAGMAELQKSRESGREISQARQAFLRSADTKELIDFYESEAAKMDGERSVWADAVVLSTADGRNGKEALHQAAREAVAKGWENPERRAQMLNAIALAENRGSRERVLEALDDPNPEVAEAARRAARALRINRPVKPKDNDEQIASLPAEQVVQRVTRMRGDRKLGEELFTRQSCNTCHTVSENEPLRGPFLGNIAKTYKREELATAVLFPSKTIAQGFTSWHFAMKDGTEVDGFVVQEAASAVTVRNVAAQELTLPTSEIAERKKLETSIMPEGLVGNLTPREFASLLDYLQSLAVETQ